MLNTSPTDLKLTRELEESQIEPSMQTVSDTTTTQMEAIQKVFQDLGLEDADTRERFRQLAKPSDWHTWRKEDSPPHDTRSNTRTQEENTTA